MTVGKLQALLAKLNTQANVLVAVNGSFVPVVGVTAASGAEFIVVRGLGRPEERRHFSVGEEGVIGHLVHLGASDQEIGEVLGRPKSTIGRKRKSLGFG
jgi:hypothetical protein